MRTTLRNLTVAGIAGLGLLIAASSATALTISPTGAYTFTSGTVTGTFTSSGQRLTCTSSTITTTLTARGTGTVAAGGMTFNGCTNALLGAIRVTNVLPGDEIWLLEDRILGVLIGRLLALASGGLFLDGGVCDIYAEGGILWGTLIAGELPLEVTPFESYNTLAVLGFRVSRTTCGLFGVPVGLAISLSGTYRINRTVRVS